MRSIEAERPTGTRPDRPTEDADATRAPDLATLRADLKRERRARKAQLHSLNQEMTEAIADGDDARRHVVDLLIRTAEAALSEFDGALDRMENGTYGTCEHCAAPIPADRLEVRPTSRLCVPCQRAVEGGRARP